MIKITAKDVSTLRSMTGAGIIDCRNALVASKGDLEKAKEFIRKKGQQLVDKKANRDTNQGLVGIQTKIDDIAIECYMAQIYCETDFVARSQDFQDFVLNSIGKRPEVIDTADIISKIKENVKIGKTPSFLIEKSEKLNTFTSTYLHNKISDQLGQIAVFVVIDSEKTDGIQKLTKDIAMHIAAMKPKAISIDELDQQFIQNELRILTEQAQETGKPDQVIEKMVQGRLKKALKEVCLLEQPFVVDPSKTVGQLLDENQSEVLCFECLFIGE